MVDDERIHELYLIKGTRGSYKVNILVQKFLDRKTFAEGILVPNMNFVGLKTRELLSFCLLLW